MAVMFCNWLSGQSELDNAYVIQRDSSKFTVTLDVTKSGYRLPTEAEWEYAARGGNKKKPYAYSGSNIADDVAWNIFNNKGNIPNKVGQKKPNDLGIYDMTGNALEWCNDWYSPTYYSMKENKNPTGPATGTKKVCRGGNFLCRNEVLRNTKRFALEPKNKDGLAGIRVAKNE